MKKMGAKAGSGWVKKSEAKRKQADVSAENDLCEDKARE